jgi:hypothetical protein
MEGMQCQEAGLMIVQRWKLENDADMRRMQVSVKGCRIPTPHCTYIAVGFFGLCVFA